MTMGRRNETVEEFCERTISTMWYGEPVDRWVVQELPTGASKWRTIETLERGTVGAGKQIKATDLVVAIERAIINADARKARVQAWVPSYTRNQVAQKIWPVLHDVSDSDEDLAHADPLAVMVEWNRFCLTTMGGMWSGTLDVMRAMYESRVMAADAELAVYRGELAKLREANNQLADKSVEREIKQAQSHAALEVAKAVTHGVTAKVLGTAPTDEHLDKAIQAFANSLTPDQVKQFTGVLRPDQMAAFATLMIDDKRAEEKSKAPLRVTPEFLNAARSRMQPDEYRNFLTQLKAITQGPATS